MGMSNFDNIHAEGSIESLGGLRSRGIPVLGPGGPAWLAKGNVYHVDSGHARASDGNPGTNPEMPMATLNAAVGRCTANNGDVILLSEGHAETILGPAGVDLDCAGISVIGLGVGNNRPAFTMGLTAVAGSEDSTIEVTADNVRLANVILRTGIDALVTLIDVEAEGFELVGCEVQEVAALQWLAAITIEGAAANDCDRTKILGCKITQVAAGAECAIALDEVNDEVEIAGCEIDGDFDDAGIHNPGGTILTGLRLSNNVVRNRQAGDHAIELVSACTGRAVGNRLMADTLGTIFDSGSLLCADNWETNAVDVAAIPSPNGAAAPTPAGAHIAAASLADDTITAAKIAASAIGASEIANNAITVDKIANNALTSAKFALSAGEKTTDGVIVTRAAANLPQTAAAPLFTVTGLVLLKRIVGYVTVEVGAVGNETKLVVSPDGAGADTDICDVLDITGHVVDSRYEITGTFANPMVRTIDLPQALQQAVDIVIPPGTIDLDCAGSDGNAGEVRWSVTYVPLEAGAQVVAA